MTNEAGEVSTLSAESTPMGDAGFDSAAGGSPNDGFDGNALSGDSAVLGEDGVVQFGDDFFKDFIGSESESGNTSENAGENANIDANANANTNANDNGNANPIDNPNINANANINTQGAYTAEELKSLSPYQWQKDRLPPNMSAREAFELASPFIRSVVQQNALFRQQLQLNAMAQANMAQGNANANNANVTAPHKMTDEEIDDAAIKLALEQLGIKENDFDPYLPKHQLALFRAADKVRNDNAQEVAEFQRQEQFRQDGAELGQFVGRLQQLPDYSAFNEWLTNELVREGRSPNAISEYMLQTGDVRAIQQIVGAYYQKFRTTPKPVQSVQGQGTTARQVQTPPAVETSGSGNYPSRRVIDLKKFGDLTDDERAEELIKLGLCNI